MISFGASLLSYLLVFFIFIVAVVAAIVIGAFIAKEKYGVDDPEILSAIAYHTTGHPDMTLMDKIIFVADYIEPNRKIIRDLPEIRKEAFIDLDRCIIHILKNTLEYLKDKEYVIDETTEETYYFYVDNNVMNELDKF